MHSQPLAPSRRRPGAADFCRGLWSALAARLLLLLLVAVLAPAASAQPLPPLDADDGVTYRVLSFHDVRTNVRASFETSPDETAIDETTLTEMFAWLSHNQYHPVSLQQIVDARAGRAKLPSRPVLLTFDDGYASAYTKVFPLLQRYRYPAVLALVTSWLEVPDGQPVPYGATAVPRSTFLRWSEVAAMARSGLVELATHTDAMHTGGLANPQGNQLPIAATHLFNASTSRYETDAEYSARVEADLRKSRELIEARTGAKVRTTVWPYGAYNALALRASERAGMPLTMKLADGPNGPDVPLSEIRRTLVTYNAQPADYARLLRSRIEARSDSVNRVMHVDLDYVYDPDPLQQEKNLSLLIDRVAAVGPSAVFLQAFSDPDGDGVADAVYFPNRHLPVRADLFGRAAWQLSTRAGVNVYAWMPVMAFRLPASDPLAGREVLALQPGGATPAPGAGRYHRLSPFDPAVRQRIAEIYDDLGRHAWFNGILFHDDATLSDDEDASPAALAVYRSWGLPGNIEAIRRDPALMARWTAGKTRYLIDFTQDLVGVLRTWRPILTTARNLYAVPLLDPDAERSFAQNYEASLAAYDYVALMAMPRMENQKASDAPGWLARLARRAASTPSGLDGTLFELQAMDWRTSKPVPDAELARQVNLLQRLGVRHIGYYPDDFLKNQPSLAVVTQALSVRRLLKRQVPGTAPQGRPGAQRIAARPDTLHPAGQPDRPGLAHRTVH